MKSTLLSRQVLSTKTGPKRISQSCYESLNVLFKETKTNSIILDAGCNTGALSGELIERGCFVYGIDVSPTAVALANYRGLFARVCPVEKLSFEDNFFDYCIAFEILEHLYNPEEGVKELYRVLKLGGKLIGSVPYPGRMLAFSSKYQRIFHQHNFTEESLRELLGKFFKSINIKVEHVGYSPGETHYRLYFTGIKNATV